MRAKGGRGRDTSSRARGARTLARRSWRFCDRDLATSDGAFVEAKGVLDLGTCQPKRRLRTRWHLVRARPSFAFSFTAQYAGAVRRTVLGVAHVYLVAANRRAVLGDQIVHHLRAANLARRHTGVVHEVRIRRASCTFSLPHRRESQSSAGLSSHVASNQQHQCAMIDGLV